jgi:hypothetical protein
MFTTLPPSPANMRGNGELAEGERGRDVKQNAPPYACAAFAHEQPLQLDRLGPGERPPQTLGRVWVPALVNHIA